MLGCIKPPLARGWCQNHYQQWYQTGDPLLKKHKLSEGEVRRNLNHDGYVRVRRYGEKDNRRENLELWVSTRSGQRVEDLVAFVVEHYPDEVAKMLRKRRRKRN